MGRITDKVWHQVFKRDKGICQYCGMNLLQDFQHYVMSTLDHVISQKSGGTHVADNLVLCCCGCNTLLSGAHHLITVEERRNYLSNPGAARMMRYDNYLKLSNNGWE